MTTVIASLDHIFARLTVHLQGCQTLTCLTNSACLLPHTSRLYGMHTSTHPDNERSFELFGHSLVSVGQQVCLVRSLAEIVYRSAMLRLGMIQYRHHLPGPVTPPVSPMQPSANRLTASFPADQSRTAKRPRAPITQPSHCQVEQGDSTSSGGASKEMPYHSPKRVPVESREAGSPALKLSPVTPQPRSRAGQHWTR